nr:hypothetical protein [Paenibacillus bovis]
MNSVDQKLVFRQYLSLLPRNTFSCPLHNYDYKKLTDESLVKIFLLAGLFRWESLDEIEIGIRSKKQIRQELDLKSISSSTLSRRLATLNTNELADMLSRIA